VTDTYRLTIHVEAHDDTDPADVLAALEALAGCELLDRLEAEQINATVREDGGLAPAVKWLQNNDATRHNPPVPRELPSYTLPQPGREAEEPWTMALELPSGDTYRVTIPGSYDPKALAKGWRKVYEPEAHQFDATRYAIETLEAAANVLAGAARTTAEEAERAYMLAAVATLRATAQRWRSTDQPSSPDQE
jgi:hypothetical protein